MQRLYTGFRRRSQPPRGADDGFTLVEVMVAVLILMMGTVALAGVLTQAVSAVSVSRQSQQASNLAASALAEAESMPWSTSPSSADSNYGLTSSDVSSDSNLTGGGSGGYCFEGMHVVVQGVVGTRPVQQHVDMEQRFVGPELPELAPAPPLGDERGRPPVPPRDLCGPQRY